jgi:nitrate reductase (NAD(P)H)
LCFGIGGGKKITRVEVTLDGGETWLVCTLDIPEKPTKYGRYWCWCFWSVEIEVLDLLGAKEVAVRAWDQTHNTQPEKLIWNLMVRTPAAVIRKCIQPKHVQM